MQKGTNMIIKSTKDVSYGRINCLVYGESGAGKTTLAGTLPGKTLIISLESGLLSLKGFDVDYVEISGATGIEKVKNLSAILKEKELDSYDTLYFDSLSEIAQCFLEFAAVEYPADNQVLKKFGHYNDLITRFIKRCRDMDKNVFFTCLQKTDKDDVGRRWNLPDVPGSVASKMCAYFDFVFNLRVFEKDGEKVRALLTSNSQGFVCKDRSGKLNEYEAPHLGDVINKVFKE